MKVTSDQLKSIAREIFAFAAALLAVYGIHSLGGINAADVIGTLAWSALTIWGVYDKTNTDKSAISSVLRKLLSLAGAFIAFYFPATSKLLAELIPALMAIVAIVFGSSDNAPLK